MALGVAFTLGLWKQWRSPSGFAVSSSVENESWRFHVEPVVERRGLALVATFKRRF